MGRTEDQAVVAGWLQTNVWKVQEDFQRKVSKLDDMTPEQRSAFTKEHVLYAIGELTELIDQIHWKIHRRQEWRQPSRSNIAIDIVDCFKYMLNVCLAWDIDAEEFLRTYAEKSRVVEERWNQEFNKPYDQTKYRGIVAVDIDGVLADYAGGYMAWVEAQTGQTLPRPYPPGWDFYAWIAKHVGSVRSEELKHRYRETGGKLSLPVLPGACSMLQWLRDADLYIAIVSARPYREYRRIMADTLSWLDLNGLHYDRMVWEPMKAARIEKEWPEILCVFEDDLSQAASIAAKGFRVFMPNQTYNVQPASSVHERWFRYDTARWSDVVKPFVENLLAQPGRIHG